jgi:hypothetical protein
MLRLASIALLALASCSTYYDVRYVPAPLETRVGDGGETVARSLVTVLGVRKADSSTGEPARVEMRMRVENLGTAPLAVEAESFELVAANLAAFEPGRLAPAPASELARNEVAEFDLWFAVPQGRAIEQFDLSGINLRWAVRFGNRRVYTGASFQRVWPGPYYYGYP